jgi:hemin uptake protein HemP
VNDLESAKPMPERPAGELASPSTLREIDSSSLLQGEKEVLIHHSGEVYRLRLTKNGKLILQK